MGKLIFNRIWRTAVIVVNSVWNLFSIVLAFYMLFESSSMYKANTLEGWIYGLIVIVAINVLDYVTRKHFTNY